MLRTTLLALALCLPLLAHAQSPAIAVESAKPFAEQRAQVAADLAGGKLYSEIGGDNRRKVEAALSRIADTLDLHGPVQSLSPEQKVSVINDQELVNNLLSQARADSRQICRREKTIGSNRAQTVCMTVAERNAARKNAEDMFRLVNPQQADTNN